MISLWETAFFSMTFHRQSGSTLNTWLEAFWGRAGLNQSLFSGLMNTVKDEATPWQLNEQK